MEIFPRFKYERSSLLWMNDILRWWFFFVDFALIIAIHHTEMISFIKLFSCHSVFPAAAHAVGVYVFCCLIILVLSFNVVD